MNTTRRALLGSCGLGTLALLVGCLGGRTGGGGSGDGGDTGGNGDGGTDGTGTGTDGGGLPDGTAGDGTGGTRPSGTGGPGLALVSTDQLPDAPVRPAIEVTRDTATEDHPPGLRATVTNESDRELTVGEGRAVVFAYRHDTANQLLLLPAGGDYPVAADCWRLTDGIAVTEEYRTVTLKPGESVSQDLELYGAPGEDACLPVGTFRFESPFSVTDGPDGESVASFTWGFEVSLE